MSQGVPDVPILFGGNADIAPSRRLPDHRMVARPAREPRFWDGMELAQTARVNRSLRDGA
jgi:hypothetical protein